MALKPRKALTLADDLAGLVLQMQRGKALAGDDQRRRLERIVLLHAARPDDLFGPRVAGKPWTGDLFPGLDQPDRDAGALAQHRIEDLARQIADRHGIASAAFACHEPSPTKPSGSPSRIITEDQCHPAASAARASSEDGGTIAARLLAWYDRHHRELPWRIAAGARAARPDPYRVWLSEIMLQQTTVEAVKPYFRAFVARWPDVDGARRAPTPTTS